MSVLNITPQEGFIANMMFMYFGFLAGGLFFKWKKKIMLKKRKTDKELDGVKIIIVSIVLAVTVSLIHLYMVVSTQ